MNSKGGDKQEKRIIKKRKQNPWGVEKLVKNPFNPKIFIPVPLPLNFQSSNDSAWNELNEAGMSSRSAFLDIFIYWFNQRAL